MTVLSGISYSQGVYILIEMSVSFVEMCFIIFQIYGNFDVEFSVVFVN